MANKDEIMKIKTKIEGTGFEKNRVENYSANLIDYDIKGEPSVISRVHNYIAYIAITYSYPLICYLIHNLNSFSWNCLN